MKSPRHPLPGLEATLAAVASLPDDQKVEALLQILEDVLRGLPMATLRRKRSQFVERFAQCGCSYEVCSAVQELVEVHLAHRARPSPGATRSSLPSDERTVPHRRF